jgi:Zn finger protein HypA/HybF involved in hydrogenase expression
VSEIDYFPMPWCTVFVPVIVIIAIVGGTELLNLIFVTSLVVVLGHFHCVHKQYMQWRFEAFMAGTKLHGAKTQNKISKIYNVLEV